jgi:cobalt/nickel transport system permease protein
MDRMTATRWLLAYALAVVAITFVHQPLALAGLLILGVAGAGKARRQLLKRALAAIVTFNLTVSLGYALVAGLRGEFAFGYLLLINLRVLLLVFLGFWFVHRVNLIHALSFAPGLASAATLAVGQIQSFRRVIGDFGLALVSRSPEPPSLSDRMRSASAQGRDLLDKSVAAAQESALAMRSRGCFDD